MIDQIKALIGEGNLDEALKACKNQINLNGVDESQDVVVLLSKIYYKRKDYSSAYFWIRKINGHTVKSKLLLESLEKKLVIC